MEMEWIWEWKGNGHSDGVYSSIHEIFILETKRGVRWRYITLQPSFLFPSTKDMRSVPFRFGIECMYAMRHKPCTATAH